MIENRLKFKGVWRDYQKRILDDLNFHLTDKKLHIVAAPGAGKTILGIEVISRINKPTVILAPTITIKNQWKERIINSFLDSESADDLVSLNLREPKFITIITYQALFSAFCGIDESETDSEEIKDDEILTDVLLPDEISDDEFLNEDSDKVESNTENKKGKDTFRRIFNYNKAKEIINILKKAKISVLCFDEAHHLRKEWWKALNYLTDNFKPSQTISLTATPPYDVDYNEWQRYESLCGPIDEIISIPELVKNGDLCPHQDFILFSSVRQKENDEILKNMLKTNEFISEIVKNNDLADLIENYLINAKEFDVLEYPEYYISLASYMKNVSRHVPNNILKIFDLKEKDIPVFSKKYQTIFLKEVLIKRKNEFPNSELTGKLYNSAKAKGLIFNKNIYLDDNPKLKKQIAGSIGKIDLIKRIVKFEYRSLRYKLRMVILADHIKYDYIDASQLGVIPIFITLKDYRKISLAVLTGSVIIINKLLENEIIKKTKDVGINDIIISPYENDENYIKVSAKGSQKSKLTNLITQLFSEGFIHVLVGTQALLGEGWDAPCINSLILSSTVSSYMLSNQMRGRAIRIDKNNPDKVSHIWHLASVKILSALEILNNLRPSLSYDEVEPVFQLYDYIQLTDRFRGFEAPSFDSPYYIQSNIERILPKNFVNKYFNNFLYLTETDFLSLNDYMLRKAYDRNNTKISWEQALTEPYNGAKMKLKSGLTTDENMKNFMYKSFYYYVAFALFISYYVAGLGVFTVLGNGFNIIPFLIISVSVFLLLIINPAIKYIRCSSPEKIIRQIAIVITETLYEMGEIMTNLKSISIESNKYNENQSIFVNISNVTPEENNLIIKCLKEILDPIENPRYLIVRKDFLFIKETKDFHAVPSIIGKNEKSVKIFKKLWDKYIGNSEIIYTRTIKGRKMLLYARKNAFSSLMSSSKSKKMSRFE